MDDFLVRIQSGDSSVEQELLEYLSVRFALITKRRIQGDEADDVAQEACLTVLQKCREKSVPREFKPWAYEILRNKIGNYYQKRDSRRKHQPSLLDIDAILAKYGRTDDAEFVHRLFRCFRMLIKRSPRYARALNLAHQGYDGEYISRKMDVKPSNLYMILSRSRKRLSQCLETGGDVE